jgi:hypothetical protein
MQKSRVEMGSHIQKSLADWSSSTTLILFILTVAVRALKFPLQMGAPMF